VERLAGANNDADVREDSRASQGSFNDIFRLNLGTVLDPGLDEKGSSRNFKLENF